MKAVELLELVEDYANRLLSAFNYPPSEYHFSYEYGSNEGEACECGHRIKRVFVVVHKPSGHTLHLGSECIETYQELAHIWNEVKTERKAPEAKRLADLDKRFNDLLSSINNSQFDKKECWHVRVVLEIMSAVGHEKVKTAKAKIARFEKFFKEYDEGRSQHKKHVDHWLLTGEQLSLV